MILFMALTGGQKIFWGKGIQRVEGEEGITCIAELTNRLVQSEFETA